MKELIVIKKIQMVVIIMLMVIILRKKKKKVVTIVGGGKTIPRPHIVKKLPISNGAITIIIIKDFIYRIM